MSKVRSKNTKLERDFYAALLAEGIEDIECNPLDLFGKPDFAHAETQTAFFLDSCFWHGCSKHFRMPRTNTDYWRKKIARNKRRDRLVTLTLTKKGWFVQRIWEHSLANKAGLERWSGRVSHIILKRRAQLRK